MSMPITMRGGVPEIDFAAISHWVEKQRAPVVLLTREMYGDKPARRIVFTPPNESDFNRRSTVGFVTETLEQDAMGAPTWRAHEATTLDLSERNITAPMSFAAWFLLASVVAQPAYDAAVEKRRGS